MDIHIYHRWNLSYHGHPPSNIYNFIRNSKICYLSRKDADLCIFSTFKSMKVYYQNKSSESVILEPRITIGKCYRFENYDLICDKSYIITTFQRKWRLRNKMKQIASIRIHRFWRNACFNPMFKHARKNILRLYDKTINT